MAERPPRRRRQARRHPARDRDRRTGSKDRRRRHRRERRPRRRARLPYPATSLAELGHAVAAETFSRPCARAGPPCERLWDEGRGMAAIRARWLAGAAGLGRRHRHPVGADTLRGTFETIDDAGQLILRTPTARPAPSPPAMSISAPPPPRGNSRNSLMIRPQSPHPEVRAIGEPRRTHPADAAPHRRCVLRRLVASLLAPQHEGIEDGTSRDRAPNP